MPRWTEFRLFLAATAALALGSAGGCRPDHGTAQGRLALLEPLVAELARPPFGTGAAVAFAVGDQLFSVERGTLHPTGAAVGRDTLFNLASVTKSLLAARVVALAGEGRLDLDAPVAELLPGVHLLDAAGRDLASGLSLRHLLRHQAGLPHQPGDQLDPGVFDHAWQSPEVLERLTRNWTLRLAHAPGAYHYSNVGYALLGAVVERVEGRRLAACLDGFLDGLGLGGHSFAPDRAGPDAASGRVVGPEGVRFNPPGWYVSGYSLPFTGAWLSARGLAGFGRQLALAARTPSSPLHELTLPPPGGGAYGLGIVHGRRGGLATLEHDGSAPGFLARVVVVPARGVALAVVCNGGGEQPEQVPRFRALTDAALGRVLDGR